jgi:hypothetical protein
MKGKRRSRHLPKKQSIVENPIRRRFTLSSCHFSKTGYFPGISIRIFLILFMCLPDGVSPAGFKKFEIKKGKKI